MLILLVLLSTATAQNLYGPSQLGQYARLLNSGNLGGFGQLNEEIRRGAITGILDAGNRPRLVGLPPLPMSHEEVMRQLTSLPPTTTPKPTARPTPPPQQKPMGMYGVNVEAELPPRPEEKIHGTFDDDGVFHPDNENEDVQTITTSKTVLEGRGRQTGRSRIRGTKIRDFADEDVDEDHDADAFFVSEYEDEDFYDDPSLRVNAEKKEKKYTKHAGSTFSAVKDIRPTQLKVSAAKDQTKPAIPSFVFRLKPIPTDRDEMLNNLLGEIEEYDDFLNQELEYRTKYPNAPVVHNPFKDLPEGQLPPKPNGPVRVHPHVKNHVEQVMPRPIRVREPEPTPVQTPSQPQQPQQLPQPAVNPLPQLENHLSNLLNIFHLNPQPLPQPDGLAQIFSAPNIRLVDINQQPVSFPQLGAPLVFNPLFAQG